MAQSATFFGIDLDRFTQRSLEIKIDEILDGLGQHLIATPNPEMLMAARTDQSVLRVLNRMNIRIPDGFGLSLMSRLSGQGKLRRFPGTDVLIDLCKSASKRNMQLTIVGGWGTAAIKAKAILETAFPGLTISHVTDMEISYIDGEWEQSDELISTIQNLRPDIIAVALGSSQYTKQERWIVDHVPQFASVKIAIGIGGAIDMIAGTYKRAPAFMQKLGLEWLWRLIQQPSRIGRIFTAVIRFPIAVIQDTITSQR